MFSDLIGSILEGIFTVIIKTWWLVVPILGFLAWQNSRKAKWVENHDSIILSIKIPKSNEKDPTAAEMMFATLHGILRPKNEILKEGSFQEHIGFEIVSTINAIEFFIWTPSHLKDFVEGQVYAQYPSAEIRVAEDYSYDIDIDDDGIEDFVVGTELKLEKTDILPINTFQNFKVDPLAGITGVLSKLEKTDEQIWIQILARPIHNDWQKKAQSYINNKKRGKGDPLSGGIGKFFLTAPLKIISEMFKLAAGNDDGKTKKDPPKLSSDEEGRLTAIAEKSTKLGYQVKARIVYLSKSKELAKQRVQAVIGTFKQFNSINLNGFKPSNLQSGRNFLDDYRARLFMDSGFILNIEELASLYHLPHTSVETPNIKWTSSKTSESPTELPTALTTSREDLTPFAETNFRHNKTEFGIKTDDRRRHAYIIGKSGMGKSKLMESFINEDIQRGNGLAVIDPNGDLIMDTLRKIPEHRMNDVIFLDPADQDFPVGFNPLEVEDESLKHHIAQGFVGILKKMFGNSWGPRLEYILNYTILALLDYPDSTVLGIVRMLTDKSFRKKVIEEIKDPVVKKFWTTEFASYSDKFATEAIAPILNKVGQFTANSLIRNMIGQTKSTFNFREAMDSKKIILINLSTGRIGEINSALLGGMIITKLQLAAMSRADTKSEDRTDFFLYVDEFQHFATESFATILSEARKYKLNLTMANQYIAQMEDVVREAVFGNVGTIITFRVGAQDAGFLEKELNPPFEANDIINLDRQQIYLKMTIDGRTSAPFSAKTITVPEIDHGNSEKIIDLSRKRYSRPKAEVEIEIAEWSDVDMGNSDAKEKENTASNVHQVKNLKTNFSHTSEPKNSSFARPIVKNINRNQAPIKNDNKTVYNKNVENNENSNDQISNTKNNKFQNISDEEKKGESRRILNASKPFFRGEPKQTQHSETEGSVQSKQSSKPLRKEIDKDTLKEIIKKAMDDNNAPRESTPKTESKTTTSTNNVTNITLENKPTGSSNTEPAQEIKPEIIKDNQETHRENPREKEIKVVTPESFKDITTIHPHERVEVKNEHSPVLNELKPGDTVVFDEKE